MQRRDFMRRLGASAAVTATGPALLSLPAQAQTYASLNSLSLKDSHGAAFPVLKRAAPIAIPSYRLGIVVRSGISATSSNVSMETTAQLVGLTLEQVRAIADKAYADLITQLAATGRPIVPFEEIKTTKGYAKLKTSNVPFGKKPFADAREVALVSPNGMPLVFTHSDSPLTDKSPMDLDNWRAINQMSVDLKAVVLLPKVVIDFAELSGSGHKVYSSNASVGIKPGLYLVDALTNLYSFQAKIALAGEGGQSPLLKRVPVGQAGELTKNYDYNNRAEIEWYNFDARTGNPNAISPGSAYSYSGYAYRVEPAVFEAAVLDGTHALHRTYAEAANTFKP